MPSAEKQKATKGQCLQLASRIVEHNSEFGKLAKDAIEFWIKNPARAIEVAAESMQAVYMEEKGNLLEVVASVRVAGGGVLTTSEEFFFEVGVEKTDFLFKKLFVNLHLDSVPTRKLCVGSLKRPANDREILEELGRKAEISVHHFYEFLSMNWKSEHPFLFYLRAENVLWAVVAQWEKVGGRYGFTINTHMENHTSNWVKSLQVVHYQ